MGTLFIAMLLFFAVRAITCFARGRTFAGVFATAACLLFLGGLDADFAGQDKSRTQVVKRTV